MTIDEYFGDWMKVLDRAETMKIMGWLKTVNPNTLCPALPNVFRAFKLCPYKECRVVFIGQDWVNKGSCINRVNCWKPVMVISSQAHL